MTFSVWAASDFRCGKEMKCIESQQRIIRVANIVIVVADLLYLFIAC